MLTTNHRSLLIKLRHGSGWLRFFALAAFLAAPSGIRCEEAVPGLEPALANPILPGAHAVFERGGRHYPGVFEWTAQ